MLIYVNVLESYSVMHAKEFASVAMPIQSLCTSGYCDIIPQYNYIGGGFN